VPPGIWTEQCACNEGGGKLTPPSWTTLRELEIGGAS
jgi:hypothetical protein